MADVTEGDGTTEREPGPMEAAVLIDMNRWGLKLSRTVLAAGALDMARRLDQDEELRPTAASLLHAQLRASVLELEKLAPPEVDADGVDELKQRRRDRRGA